MHWQNLSVSEWIIVAAGTAAAILCAVPLFRFDSQRDAHRRDAEHRAYFQQGGLIRTLMSRWGRGTPRLTDQRRSTDD